jgi:hypothetical protein
MGRPFLAAALTALLLAAVCAEPGATADGLVTRTAKEGGFTVKLPPTWHYRNASYPSDHSTEYWTDPANPTSRLEVNVSGCIGCAERESCTVRGTGCGPYPAGLVPHGTISKHALGKWAEQFVARVPGSPDLDRGLVVIDHQGKAIQDWAYVQLWLPSSQTQLADTILASFALH